MKHKQLEIAIVVSKFNYEITNEMKKHAISYAKKNGAVVNHIAEVPGAFEIPFVVQSILEKKNVDGVATLGAVVKGQTNHDEVIVYSVVNKILELSIAYKKPVSLGIIGPNATWEQAMERRKEYAERSIQAVIDVLKLAIN